nr:LysR substrate-binding domain-containing protein [Paenibacillus hamazuiensis]
MVKLEIVELIERHKKITPVAGLLGLKQPTVTFHMKNLEEELGVPLFESRAGKINLTEAGAALHHYAVKINALAQEAERVVKEFREPGTGSLKIGASYVPGTYILPELISRFVKNHPKTKLSLSIKPASLIKDMLLNHEIDIGVFSAGPAAHAPLAIETVCEDEMVVIFAPNHKFSRYEQLYPDMLNDVPFLFHSPESSTRALTEKWAQANGVQLSCAMELDSVEAIKQVAMRGEGVSFVSRLAVGREVERGELAVRAIPQNHVKRYVFYAFNEHRHKSSLMDAFIDYIRSSVTPLR